MNSDPKALAERKKEEAHRRLYELHNRVLEYTDGGMLVKELVDAVGMALDAALLAADKVARWQAIQTLGHVRSCRCDYAPTMDRSGEDPRCRAERSKLAAEVGEMERCPTCEDSECAVHPSTQWGKSDASPKE